MLYVFCIPHILLCFISLGWNILYMPTLYVKCLFFTPLAYFKSFSLLLDFSSVTICASMVLFILGFIGLPICGFVAFIKFGTFDPLFLQIHTLPPFFLASLSHRSLRICSAFLHPHLSFNLDTFYCFVFKFPHLFLCNGC